MKKIKLALVLSIVIWRCSTAEAQRDRRYHRKEAIDQVLKDTFSFVQLRNDPANAANLTLSVNPFYFELYGLNSNLGYDASLRYRWHNTLAIGVEYGNSYYESVEKANIGQIGSFGPATGTSNLQNISLGLDYYFNTKIDTDLETVNIGRYRGFMFTEGVHALYQEQYGLRLGVQYFQTYISGDQIPFSGYYENDPSKRMVNFGLEQVGTMLEENIINIGASITNRHDLLITNPTLGKSKIMGETYLYGDILYAPAMTYTNVIMTNYEYISREQYTDFNINSGITKSRLGFRVGFNYTDLSRMGLPSVWKRVSDPDLPLSPDFM